MKKKKIIVILIIIFIVIGGVLSLFIKNQITNKFNMDNIKTRIINEYPNLNLRELDQYDVSLYFGIELNNIPSSFFITDFVESEDNMVFNPNNLVVMIQSDKIDEYYSILESYLEINKNNAQELEKINLYNGAILKKYHNYAYLIIGQYQEKIEKIINE